MKITKSNPGKIIALPISGNYHDDSRLLDALARIGCDQSVAMTLRAKAVRRMSEILGLPLDRSSGARLVKKFVKEELEVLP